MLQFLIQLLKKWFQISTDYLAKLNDDIKKYASEVNLNLPDWEGELKNKDLFDSNLKFDEGDYNDKVSKLSNFQLFDKKNFQFKKTNSKVEICDLYEKETKSLICVKKLTSSSTLSHLFSQGSVSAKLFSELEDSKKYKEKFPNELTVENFKKERKLFTFVYAIGTEKEGDLLDLLTVFSKINLFSHIKSITNLGFNVALKKINIVDILGFFCKFAFEMK